MHVQERKPIPCVKAQTAKIIRNPPPPCQTQIINYWYRLGAHHVNYSHPTHTLHKWQLGFFLLLSHGQSLSHNSQNWKVTCMWGMSSSEGKHWIEVVHDKVDFTSSDWLFKLQIVFCTYSPWCNVLNSPFYSYMFSDHVCEEMWGWRRFCFDTNLCLSFPHSLQDKSSESVSTQSHCQPHSNHGPCHWAIVMVNGLLDITIAVFASLPDSWFSLLRLKGLQFFPAAKNYYFPSHQTIVV